MEMLLSGALVGLSIAIPPGPNAAVCISRTLAAGRGVGLRCGFGAASAHAIYAVLAVVGRRSGFQPAQRKHRCSAHRRRPHPRRSWTPIRLVRTAPLADRGSTKGAYFMTLAVGLGNPSPFSTSPQPWRSGPFPLTPVWFASVVVGVFVGSAFWWAALTSLTAAVHQHLNERRVGWVNRLTASAIGGCGVMAVATAL